MIVCPAVTRISRAPSHPPPVVKAMPAKRARTMELAEFEGMAGQFTDVFVDAVAVTLVMGYPSNEWVGSLCLSLAA